MSGARVVGPVAPPSPVLRRRSLSSRSEAIDIEFGDLHKAAKAAGGSINDAYLAGLCGALRLYHEADGRADRGAADGGAGQPAVRGGSGRRQPVRRCQSRRADRPARPRDAHQEHPFADDAQARGACASTWSAPSPRCSLLLPDSVLESMAGSIVNSDVRPAMCRSTPVTPSSPGRRSCGSTALGPLPGVAMMVRADLARRLLHDHHALRPRVDRRLRPVGSLPAGRLRRGARSRRRRYALRRRRSRSTPRAHPSLTERKCGAMTSANGQPNPTHHAAARLGRRDRGAAQRGPRSVPSSISTAPWSPGSPA